MSEQIEELVTVERQLRNWMMRYAGSLKLSNQHRLRVGYDAIDYILLDLKSDELKADQERQRQVEELAADKAERELHRRGVLLDEPAPTFGVKGSPE